MPPLDAAPVVPQPQAQSQQVVPLQMGKFKASLAIVKESWQILMSDKEIMLFPVASSFVSLIALIVLGVLYFFIFMGGDLSGARAAAESQSSGLSYLLLFVYYLVMYFIVNFFQAGIFTIVHSRFNGQNLTFSDGIRGAMNNVGKIFQWSLISATVGVILQMIADRSKIIGKIVAAILGAAWNILTYFSLPSLIIGQTSVIDSFKDSASTIRRVWGESIIINLGVGLFFSLIVFVAFFVALGLCILIQAPIAIGIIIVLYVIFNIGLALISSSLSVIFKLAIYEYARTGIVPEGFSPELVQNAIRAK